MREIKFRAWDTKENKFFEPTYKAYEGKLEDLYISLSGELGLRTIDGFIHEYLFKNRFVLQQFTGLLDKNNKPIYEGDIISIPMGLGGNNIGVVKFGSYAAGGLDYYSQTAYGFYGECITEEDNDLDLQYDDIEIIGNIYEHKHLLEDK